MASNDSRTTQQLLVALGFDYSKYDHDSLVREALRELEELRTLINERHAAMFGQGGPLAHRAQHRYNAADTLLR